MRRFPDYAFSKLDPEESWESFRLSGFCANDSPEHKEAYIRAIHRTNQHLESAYLRQNLSIRICKILARLLENK